MERRSPYTHPATLATRQKSQAHPHSPQAGSDFPRAPYFPANPYLAKKPAEKHPHPKARIWSLVPKSATPYSRRPRASPCCGGSELRNLCSQGLPGSLD